VIGIVGAGAWGTALGNVIAERGEGVMLWSDIPEIVNDINSKKQNDRSFPGVMLSPNLRATSSLSEIAAAAQLLVVAVRSTRVQATVRALGDVVSGRHIIVHAIGAATQLGRVSELVRTETPVKRVGALAGPALAADLIEGKPCAVVVASNFEEVLVKTRAAIESPPTLRVYRSGDLAGVELASALTGAYTVAFGIADSIGLGHGPRAVLFCRCLAEATRLGVANGAREKTFAGLAGLGNLMVRATGSSSDDYLLGVDLGSSKPVERQTEGTRATLSLQTLARRLGLRTPILDAIAAVLAGAPAREMAVRLMEGQGEEE
jgi:glycerol-3-phosphate dehydrogenase (NAD(P)+)